MILRVNSAWQVGGTNQQPFACRTRVLSLCHAGLLLWNLLSLANKNITLFPPFRHRLASDVSALSLIPEVSLHSRVTVQLVVCNV